MAKGKRATALFEVMSKARLPGRASQSSASAEENTATPASSAPRWWFKSKAKDESTVRVMAPTTPALDAASEPAQPAETSETPAATMAVAPPAGAAVVEAAPRPEPLIWRVDRDRQQISLKLSYTSAMIGGFGLVLVVAIAVLIGKSLSRGPSTAIANVSSQQLRQGPVTPGVMNVPRRSETAGSVDTGAQRASAAAPAASATPSTGTRSQLQSFNDPRPPTTFFTDDPKRVNGLNYAIIQSYPNKETAEKAADFLTKHGIPCTVEKDLPNWPLPWQEGCVVVGIRGFAKVRDNPQLEAYKKSIMEISGKFAAGKSRFMAFSPQLYQWKKSN